MRRARYLLCVAGLMCAASWLRSGQPASPQAIVDRAIKAHGGQENLNKFKAAVMKGKGTFYGLGKGVPYTGEWSVQGAQQMRFALESTLNGKTFKMIEVVNARTGWIKILDQEAKEMKKDQHQEELEEQFAGWIATLAPLNLKGFKLSTLGEVKVEGKPAVGVKVEHKGHRYVNLFFDKDSGLLVKSEFQVKDVEKDADKEMTQEVLFKGYKTIQGLKQATQITINRDGKLFIEAEMSDIRMHEELDAATFARP
jgi:hypothetical protein